MIPGFSMAGRLLPRFDGTRRGVSGGSPAAGMAAVAALLLAVAPVSGWAQQEEAPGQEAPGQEQVPEAPDEQVDDTVIRGEYVFRAAGCFACHTDTAAGGEMLAGGPAVATAFGTFYAPNITPDPVHGIGGWSEADFFRALREGVAPDGSHYYPAFPYTSYTGASDQDLRDLKAYLDTVPPVARPSRPHELSFPYSWRPLLAAWKWQNFEPGRFEPDPARPDSWNRGAYLTVALAHCAECHTPRGRLGGWDRDAWMAGSRDGPTGERVPNITPDPGSGIGNWSQGDVAWLLLTGATPIGDVVGGSMGAVIEHGTRHLTNEDRQAIAEYLMSLPPQPD